MTQVLIRYSSAVLAVLRQWLTSHFTVSRCPSVSLECPEEHGSDEESQFRMVPGTTGNHGNHMPAAEPKPVRQRAGVRRQKASAAKPDGISVEWQFRRDILDKLDEYFLCFSKLRRHDPDAYALLSRVGLAVPASAYMNGDNDGNRRKVTFGGGPSFGGVLMPTGEEHLIYPSFLYFTKVKTPAGIEFAHGDVYALTAVFDERKRTATGISFLCRCHVVVMPSGHISLLREARVVTSTVYRTAGAKKEKLHLKGVQWVYPTWLSEMKKIGETAENVAASLFVMAMGTYTKALDRTVIRTTRKGITATFGIDLARCRTFFADREATALAKDGKRKRIFHAVTRHERHVGQTVQDVRAHYRGLRFFDWKGYKIGIVWPKTDIRTFTAAMDDNVPEAERQHYLTAGQTGKVIASVLES